MTEKLTITQSLRVLVVDSQGQLQAALRAQGVILDPETIHDNLP